MTGLEHQHTRSFIVLKHQYGRREVIRSITQAAKNHTYDALKGVIFDMTSKKVLLINITTDK